MKEQHHVELESLSDRSMPGLRREQIGDWLLREALASSGRANSVWVRGDPGCAVSTAIDQAEHWYGRRDMTPIFQIFDGNDPEIGHELDSRGYRTVTGAVVMTADLESLDSAGPTAGRSASSESPDRSFVSLVGDDDRLAETVMTPLDKCFVTVFDDDGGLLGGGLGVIDGRWLGVFAMNTRPEARRRGVARRVLRDLIKHGRHEGATTSWLQVMPTNGAARALYRSVGFVDSHVYHYRAGPNWRE